MLGFLGRNSAFCDVNNGAYFYYENSLVLIDCPVSSFNSIRKAVLTDISSIYVIVTHTHSDHIGGIPLLIEYEYFVGKIPVKVITPDKAISEDIRYLLTNLEGCDDYWYYMTEFAEAKKNLPFLIDVIPTSHTPSLEGKCFGYELRINNRQVIYTGDTNTLTPFISRLTDGAEFYTEISSIVSPVHLYIEDVLDTLVGLTNREIDVYLMHLDDEAAIADAIKDTKIKLATLKPLEDTMNNMIDEIFDITNNLYCNIYQNKDDTHNDIFTNLTELGKTLGQCDRASFWKWDKRKHTVWTTAASGVNKIEIPDNTGLVGKAIASKSVVITNDPYNDPDFNSAVDKATGYVTKSILVLPVADVNGNFIGAYQLINKLSEDGFDMSDVRKLSLAALICGLALESETYLDDSHHDKLTSLKNRMGFYYDFSHKYSKYLNDTSAPISMFICDIDKFKSVNDTYGHNAGDDVLSFVANKLKNCCDESQTIYRWGGEEFIMIMPDAKLEDAAKKAEEMRVAIMNSTIEADGNTLSCTLSFGCHEFDISKTIEDNISVADGRLYTAKNTGRNRVVSV